MKRELILEDDIIEVFSFPLKHKIPTCGFLIKEKPKKIKNKHRKVKGKRN